MSTGSVRILRARSAGLTTRSASRGTSGFTAGLEGDWHAEHHKTPNGLWLRMPQITVESLAQFQIGEQRFQLRVK